LHLAPQVLGFLPSSGFPSTNGGMLQTDVRRVRFPFFPTGVRRDENGFDKGVELVQVDVGKYGAQN